MSKRKQHHPKFKAKVALEAPKGEETVNQLASRGTRAKTDRIIGEQAAALIGLAPIAHDSGAMRAKHTIGGGRRLLRHVMFQAALVAGHHNPDLKSFADRLRAAGKPQKAVIIAVARKLTTTANALVKSG